MHTLCRGYKVLIFLLVMFQHLLIPPYGMPIPYPGLLPPWGVHTHPNMTTVILVTYISTPLLLINIVKFMNLSSKLVTIYSVDSKPTTCQCRVGREGPLWK
jgi:hypothetical protein